MRHGEPDELETGEIQNLSQVEQTTDNDQEWSDITSEIQDFLSE